VAGGFAPPPSAGTVPPAGGDTGVPLSAAGGLPPPPPPGGAPPAGGGPGPASFGTGRPTPNAEARWTTGAASRMTVPFSIRTRLPSVIPETFTTDLVISPSVRAAR
jgi:hypothetical protein